MTIELEVLFDQPGSGTTLTAKLGELDGVRLLESSGIHE